MRRCAIGLAATAALLLTTLSPSPAEAAPLLVVVSASGPAIAGPTTALGDFDLHMAFNAGVTVQSVTFGSELNLGVIGNSFQLADAGTPGVLRALEISFVSPATLVALQADTFTLISVLFETGALTPAAAFASLQLQQAVLGDAIGNPLEARRLLTVSADGLTPVPEPATALLLGTAIASWIARSRRRRERDR
jgi:hypothetical protein